jgi:putative DNA primase/helicase
MSRITAVAPGVGCPLWRAFLERITAGDQELQKFLQRVAGYALTGSTREHVLFFAHGRGRNGKGTFINTLTGILAGYAATAAIQTFIASPTDRHPCDVAMLRGARLVTAQETEDGRRWAESRINAMTGGDPLTARFMHQNFFTFMPQFKLFITGNHRPGLRNVTEAIRHRLLLIPFTVTIPQAEQDKRLQLKLRAEWGGILAWAIEGCLEWQRIGLAPPAAVIAASEQYLASEDLIQEWITEHCESAGSTYTDILYSSHKAWLELGGEFVPSRRKFATTLVDRGFRQERDRRAGPGRDRQFIVGLRLKTGIGAVLP